jgi:hypothetical protein
MSRHQAGVAPEPGTGTNSSNQSSPGDRNDLPKLFTHLGLREHLGQPGYLGLTFRTFKP